MTKALAPKGGKDTSSTLQKSLEIMRLITRDPQFPPSAAQIAEVLKLPRPTTNRLISNLIKIGMLKREPKRSHLIEGPQLLEFALTVVTSAAQRGPRHEILMRLAQETSETCNVGIVANGQVMYIDRVESAWPLSLRLEAGSQVPLHCSAIGKILLGQMSERQQEKYLKTLRLRQFTNNTITDPTAFRKELADIASQGIAYDNEEYLDGVIGMAVPIPLKGAKSTLALAIAAPSARLKITDLRRHLDQMIHAAEQLKHCYEDDAL